ncbi:MAG: MFS transporter, partial [Sulfobacillus sp.]
MNRSTAAGWMATDVFSTFGDQLYKFALPWVLLAATRSTWDLSLVSTVQQGAVLLFGLAIGVLMDQPRRLQWMMLALVGEGICVGVIAYLPMDQPMTLVAVYILIFAIAVMGQLYKTGVRSVLPLVVRDGQLEQANGVIQSARTAMQMVGPLVAGWLVLRMQRTPFVVDGISFVVLAAMLFVMRPAIGSRLPDAASRSSLWREARDGIRHLRADKVLLRLAIIMAITNLGLTGTLAMVIYPIQREFHLHSVAGGLILAGASLGSMLGSLATATVVNRLGTIKALVGALILLGLGTAAMASSVLA